MWNETVEHENGAGGWAGGESSFMTDRKPDSKATTLGDRLPVPVTISNLIENFNAQDDKYIIGNFRFATVLTVGNVKEIHQDGTSFTYELCDPENENMEFRAVKYDGDGPKSEASLIVEGSRVRAIGKLKSFGGSHTIMLFNIVPLTDDKDYTIFQLEAEAARLFFQKNMNDKLRSEAFASKLQGMLALPRTRQNVQNAAPKTENKERLYPAEKPQGKQGGDLKERIEHILKAVSDEAREEGSNIEWIAEQLGEKDMNLLRETLANMVEHGQAYTTTDDDCFSVI